MCPSMTPPPAPFASVLTGAALRGWYILGVCFLLCIAIILFGRRFDSGRSIVSSCIIVIGFGVGMFVVLGIADSWGQNLLAWYGKNLDALAAYNCPIEGARTRYLRLDAQQQR